MLTEFVPFHGILFNITWFEINGEELILCESNCIVWNREYGECCMDSFLVMETMYNLEVSVLLSIMNMVF